MDEFRLFFVITATARPGKSGEAAQWYREKGQAFMESYPGVKSLQVFAGQFGIGRKHGIEFWFEIENYAVMDAWDAAIADDPAKYGAPWAEYSELFESGPSRVMGDWPESHFGD